MTAASDQAVLNAQWNAAVEAQHTATEQRRPSVLFRPTLSLDGTQWCALYGTNIQEAMRDFDRQWGLT